MFRRYKACRILASVCLFLSLHSQGLAGELLNVTWPTKHAADPPQLEASAQRLLPAFRALLPKLPEGIIAVMALAQPGLLGLTKDAAAELQPLIVKRYELILADPLFKDAPSCLSYCFSEKRPDHGLASIFKPGSSSERTPVILFLHGYGGSFIWYQHYLASLFPEHIIICPAYGISSANLPEEYINECLAASEKKLGHRINRPTLVGLSAGGFGALRLYAKKPEAFRKLLVIAAFPPPDCIAGFGAVHEVSFIAGGEEPFVIEGLLGNALKQLMQRGSKIRSKTVPGADHFFLLTNQKESVSWLREELGD